MSQTKRVSRNNTSIRHEAGDTVVRLHSTDVVRFNADTVTLDSGGYRTATTKTRMNQVANEYGLGFTVFAKAFDWLVRLKSGMALSFTDGMSLKRSEIELLAEEVETYRIVRHYFKSDNEIMETGLTLAEAQAHCRRDDTSSHSTGPGAWFDGYESED